jgi:hypothetical protein
MDLGEPLEANFLLTEVERASPSPRQRYLACLFLGRLSETGREPGQSERWYRSAISAQLSCQAARLALAGLLEAAGDMEAVTESCSPRVSYGSASRQCEGCPLYQGEEGHPSVEFSTVDVSVTRDGRPFTGLTVDNFRGLDNGVPQPLDRLMTDEVREHTGVVAAHAAGASTAGGVLCLIRSRGTVILAETHEATTTRRAPRYNQRLGLLSGCP